MHKPVQILPAQDADMDRVFEVANEAFHNIEPMWAALHPNATTTLGRKLGAERMRLSRNSEQHATWLKAIDERGDIVGIAKWYVLNNVTPVATTVSTADSHLWESTKARSYFGKLMPGYWERRDEAIARSNGNLVGLDLLAIHPDYQRRKIGDALVKWGTETADQLGVEAVVESSLCGRGLYEKNGFIYQEDFEARAPGDTQPLSQFAWMIRPSRANSVSSDSS